MAEETKKYSYEDPSISKYTQKQAKKSNIYLSPEEKRAIVRGRIFIVLLGVAIILVGAIAYAILGLFKII
ncbi:MAG: hypothetical protein RR578_04405 [Bacilli bacterium]